MKAIRRPSVISRLVWYVDGSSQKVAPSIVVRNSVHPCGVLGIIGYALQNVMCDINKQCNENVVDFVYAD